MIASRAFLHQCFDVVTLTSLESNGGRLLRPVFQPFPFVCPSIVISDPSFVSWIIIGAQGELNLIIARDPEDIVTRSRRTNVSADAASIVVANNRGRSFEDSEVLCKIRLFIYRDIRNACTRNVGPEFLSDHSCSRAGFRGRFIGLKRNKSVARYGSLQSSVRQLPAYC